MAARAGAGRGDGTSEADPGTRDAVRSRAEGDARDGAGETGEEVTASRIFSAWVQRLSRATQERSGRQVRSATEALRLFYLTRKTLPTDLLKAIIAGVETTAASRGSIGWLLRHSATQAAWDGTERFNALLRRAQSEGGVDAPTHPAAHALDATGAEAVYGARFAGPVMRDGPAYLLVPGLFGQYWSCYLWNVRDHFKNRGAEVRISQAADGEAGVAANAAALAREILEYHAVTGGREIVLIGHSKGGVDCAAALAVYEEQLSGIVRGLITVQCPYAGSPIAADLLSSPALSELVAKALELLVGLPPGGGRRLLGPIKDLTYSRRQAFLQRFPLPARFPCVSMHTSTSSKASFMYLPAAYVRRRYNQASDGLVACCDAEVPGCVAVRFQPEQDHCDCVFPRVVEQEMLDRHRAECAAAVKEWRRMAKEAVLEVKDTDQRAANSHADADAAGNRGSFEAERRPGPDLVPVSIARLEHRTKTRELMPMPPALGPVIVRAYVAWIAALPDRIKGVAAPGEYHEALAALLMEQPRPGGERSIVYPADGRVWR